MHEIPQKTPFKITQRTLKTPCCEGFGGEYETNENKGSNWKRRLVPTSWAWSQ